MRYNRRRQSGMTLVELLVATMLGLVLMLAVGILFVDAHKGWLNAFESVHGTVLNDARATDIVFDRLVRRSAQSTASVDPDGEWVEVQYYESDASTQLDVFARFYLDDDQLKLRRGELPSGTVTGVEVLASSVVDVDFVLSGPQVQMRLELDDGQVQTVLTSSAVMHN